MKSDTLAAGDTKIFHTEFAAGDYEAYVSEVPYANYSKSIKVHYKNVLVTTAAIYFKEWFPVTAPLQIGGSRALAIKKHTI